MKCLTVGLLFLLACASPLPGQTFVEIGGGWNEVMPKEAHGDFWATGYNLRASIGRAVTPRLGVRVDAFTLFQFEPNVPIDQYQPCSTSSCTATHHDAIDDGRVVGAAANGLVNIDRRGIVYVIGGAALFRNNEMHLGVLAGAGLAVPLGVKLRAVAEARWLGPLSSRGLNRSMLPITIALRY